MRDIVGKRNWYFAFSLALTIPGIIFILLGPLTGGQAGLQFSIDYTGGTKWEIRFEDVSVTPDQVKAVLVAEGYGDSTVQTTSNDFLLIRTEPIGFVETLALSHRPRPRRPVPRPRHRARPGSAVRFACPVRQPGSLGERRHVSRPERLRGADPRPRDPRPELPGQPAPRVVRPADAGPARTGHADRRDRRARRRPSRTSSGRSSRSAS